MLQSHEQFSPTERQPAPQRERPADIPERRVEQPASPEQVYEKIQADLKEVGAQYHQLDQLRQGIQGNLDRWGKFLDAEMGAGRDVMQYGPQLREVHANLEAAKARLKQLGNAYYELTQEIEPFDQLRENDETLKRQATESVEVMNGIKETQEQIERTRYAWQMTTQHRDRVLEEVRQSQKVVTQLEVALKEQEGWEQHAKEQIQLYRPYAEHPQYGDTLLPNGVTYKQYLAQLEAYHVNAAGVIHQTRTQLTQAEDRYIERYRNYTGLDQQQAELADRFLQAQTRLSELHQRRFTLQQEGYQTKYDRPILDARVQGVTAMRQQRRPPTPSVPSSYN